MTRAPLVVAAMMTAQAARAALFPTEPVQATVWTADRPAYVRWTDDGRYPTLSEMGPLDIGLWWHTDTSLVRLASGVDPTTKRCLVTVPGTALKPGSLYTLRLTTRTPVDVVVYSADFAIEPANGTTTGTDEGTDEDEGTGATLSESATGSGFRTVVTTSSWTASSSTWSSPTPTTLGPSASPSSPSSQTGPRTPNAGRRGVDVEKLKFRFVFVIWPVLMGVTMAL